MSSQTVNSERRKNSRKEPPSLIYVELGPGNGGMMRDLSEEGFALRAMIPLHVGEKTPFSFLLSTTVRIEGEGEILWVEERGRVAGVRFAELTQLARTQIQSWLNGTLENKEEADKPGASDVQSFEELRKELRSPGLRGPAEQPKPHWSISRPTAQPEPVANEPLALPPPQAPPVVNVTADVDASAIESVEEEQETESPAEPSSFPGLPDFPTTKDAIEISFEPPSPAAETELESGWKREHANQQVLPEIPANEKGEEFASPELPDITRILIQPPRKDAEYNSKTAALPTLEPLSLSSGAGQGAWTDWFTLSRAVGIMAVLALVVAASVYHRVFGEGLIWLGEQLGGSGTGQVLQPPSAENPAGDVTNAQPTNAVPTPDSTAPASSPETTAPTETAPVNKAAASLPSIPKGTSPPVSPLSGMSAGAGSETGQETGLSEYSHAMQLLRGKNATEDKSEAVRLLWVSVEKGNPSAELTLAELYWRGEGVARNCDQTRILLSAAARKGNADALKRLQQFQQEGCE
ncbi:MAG TPA: PilZ domain-containing protein [Candidatus Acidoferrales bacterium]|nr:PilZ domain-containing protein [Candidatus Acidoferrales bacterium]